jgi:hypothetical protein
VCDPGIGIDAGAPEADGRAPRNADTGKTLTEQDHYAAHVDFIGGEVTETGQSWQLRDEDGRLVLAGAGLFEIDLLAGDVVRETPNAKPSAAAIICPVLSRWP